MEAGRNFSHDAEDLAVLKGIDLTIRQAGDPTFVVDDLGNILLANDAASTLTHPDRPATLCDLDASGQSDPLRVVDRATRRSMPSHLRLTLVCGRSFVFSVRRLDFQLSDGRHLALLQADRSKTLVSKFIAVQSVAETARDRLRQSLAEQADLRREAEQLRRLASTDHLTGLLNAAAFSRRVGDKISRARSDSGTLLYLDLNGFKGVNDQYGHAVGDAVLKIIAQRLRGELRRQDLIARLGGDEFAIWLGGISAEVRLRVIARLRAALSAPLCLPPFPDRIETVSTAIGHAQFPEDGDDVKSLLQAADGRMYADKSDPGARDKRICSAGPRPAQRA